MNRIPLTRELVPALIAVGFSAAAARRFHLTIDPRAAGVILLGALCVYGADHQLGTRRRNGIRFGLPFLWILLGSGALLVLFFTGDHLNGPVLAAYLALSQLYVFPVLPGGRRLQDFPAARFCAILGGWTALPFLFRDFEPTAAAGLYLGAAALYLAPDIVWSDLADAGADRRAGRPTLFTEWSAASVKRLSRPCLAASGILFALSESWMLAPGPLLFLIAQETMVEERFARHSDLFLLWPLLAAAFIPR